MKKKILSGLLFCTFICGTHAMGMQQNEGQATIEEKRLIAEQLWEMYPKLNRTMRARVLSLYDHPDLKICSYFRKRVQRPMEQPDPILIENAHYLLLRMNDVPIVPYQPPRKAPKKIKIQPAIQKPKPRTVARTGAGLIIKDKQLLTDLSQCASGQLNRNKLEKLLKEVNRRLVKE